MARLSIEQLAPLPNLPIPLYEAMKIAETDVEGFGACDIVVGLTHDMASKLILRSQDDADTALGHTTDRARFQDHEAYVAWLQRGRVPFALIHRESGGLMAFVWIGPKKPPFETTLDWETLAYRSYPPYRGSGFMTSFVGYVIERYLEVNQGKKLWASIHAENVASRALAERLGFVEIAQNEADSGRVILTR